MHFGADRGGFCEPGAEEVVVPRIDVPGTKVARSSWGKLGGQLEPFKKQMLMSEAKYRSQICMNNDIILK